MRSTAFSARFRALAASLVLVGAFLPGCAAPVRIPFSPGLPPELEEDRERAFWMAVSELELMRATRIAPGNEHADYARGMRLVIDGRIDDAEDRFAPLAAEAADSLVRTAARLALSSVFGLDGRWQALHDLTSSVPAHLTAAHGRASLDAWSEAMRMAPEAEYHISAAPGALTFEVTGTGTPLIPVEINGQLRHFWLDTGTSLTLIASDVAAAAGIRPLTDDTLEIVTTVRRIQATPAVVSELRLGPLLATGHAAAVVPARDLTITEGAGTARAQRVKIDGVIGMDILSRLNVVIDFPTGVAILSRPRPDRDRKRNLFWLGYPVVRAEGPRGTPLYFGLDTGADSTFVTQNLLRKLPSRLRAKRTRYLSGFGADTLIRTPILSDLSLKAAGKSFNLRDVTVHDNRRLMVFELDGILGADLGAGHRVRIDMTNGIFEIGTPPPPPIPRAVEAKGGTRIPLGRTARDP